MKIKIKISSISIICLFVMLLGSALYADNLTDKHVYSFYTENFNGATIDSSRSDDNVIISIWNGGGDGAPSLITTTDVTSVSSPKEGNYYYAASCTGGGGWSGLCYTFADASNVATTKNISVFSSLEFWIKPKTGDVSNIGVGITAGGVDKTVTLASLGVNNASHAWQKVTLPFSSFAGANLSSVKNVFLFITSGSTATFDLDCMVMKKSTTGSFDATLKNISDDSAATKITWTNPVLGSSWVASAQYLDLTLDTLTNDSWTVKIYTDNGAANKNGLVATTEPDQVLPVCWRIHKEKIPNEDGDTLTIAQGSAPDYSLYDGGKFSSDPSYYPWFYIVDAAQTVSDGYNIAWSYKGFHGAVGNIYYGMNDMSVLGIYPKIYFGANFQNALGGLTYNANIKLELSYE